MPNWYLRLHPWLPQRFELAKPSPPLDINRRELGGERSPTDIRGFDYSRLIHPLGEEWDGSWNTGCRVWGGPSEDPWPAGRWAPEAAGPRVQTAVTRVKNLIFVFLEVMVFGCSHAAKPKVEDPSPPIKIIGSDLLSPQSLAVRAQNTYLISHLDADGKGAILQIKKGVKETIVKDLTSPKGLDVDHRRARLFVVDENTVKVFKLKPPYKELGKIDVKAKGSLNQIAFSIMNHRAYVTDTNGNSIWAIDPKSFTATLLASSNIFESLGKGSPYALYPSSDGTHLYVTTVIPPESTDVKETALLKLDLKSLEVTTVSTFTNFSCIQGLDTYKGYLVLVDCQLGQFEALRFRDGKRGTMAVPKEFGSSLRSFKMDLHFATVLRDTDLLQFPVEVKP